MGCLQCASKYQGALTTAFNRALRDGALELATLLYPFSEIKERSLAMAAYPLGIRGSGSPMISAMEADNIPSVKSVCCCPGHQFLIAPISAV